MPLPDGIATRDLPSYEFTQFVNGQVLHAKYGERSRRTQCSVCRLWFKQLLNGLCPNCDDATKHMRS